jgi:hypothetical protein
MSRIEQEPTIICIEPELYILSEYELNTSYQPPIDLQDQPQLPVSCSRWNETYTAYYISKRFVVIEITATNTLVKIEHPWRSKPLHVHIIEHLCPVCDIYGNEFDEVSGHTIFVIFTDHILRIHLEDRKLGSLFEECKTDFSFRISETESSSFRIIEDDKHERLRACLVLDETSWKKVELFEINLFRDDECLFTKSRENFFRLPPNITGIEINLEDDYIILSLTGKSTKFPIYIYDGKTDALDDYYASPIFLLNEFERCILATSDQLDRFQMIGFQIVGTVYVCPFEDDDDFPEIKEFIKVMLEELNKYHGCRWDSDCGSDSD